MDALARKKLFRLHRVEDLTGLKKSTIYEKMAKNEFPQSISIGRRAIAWRVGDIEDWLDSLGGEASR
jgi:prophage regulatory protein